MRHLLVACVLLLLSAGASAEPASATLQVTCPPGHRVYLDGELVGLTTVDEDGLHLRWLAPGPHVLRVEKLGFLARELAVELTSDRMTEVKVERLVSQEETPQPMTVSPKSKTPPPTPLPTIAPEPATPQHPAIAAGPSVEPVTRVHALSPPPAATLPPPERPAVENVPPVANPPVQRPAQPIAGVSFVYRVRGGSRADGRSVTIWREVGGPRSPVLVFTCAEPACEDRTNVPYPPGTYRFRLLYVHRGAKGRDVLFEHQAFLDLEAADDRTYLIDAHFDGDSAAQCSAVAGEVQ